MQTKTPTSIEVKAVKPREFACFDNTARMIVCLFRKYPMSNGMGYQFVSTGVGRVGSCLHLLVIEDALRQDSLGMKKVVLGLSSTSLAQNRISNLPAKLLWMSAYNVPAETPSKIGKGICGTEFALFR